MRIKNKDSQVFIDAPRKAVGEMMPVLLATSIAIPVSMNGMVKSAAYSRSALIVKEVITISTRRLAKAPINPFHRPFYISHFAINKKKEKASPQRQIETR